MAPLVTIGRPLNWKLEVFKNSVQLFNTRFTQILIYPNLIVFSYDLFSECAVLSPTTNISLEKPVVAPLVTGEDGSGDGSSTGTGTRIRIEIPHSLYSDHEDLVFAIEALKPTSASILYDEVLVAAGQKVPQGPDVAMQPAIQQLTNVLYRCLESMTNAFLETYKNQCRPTVGAGAQAGYPSAAISGIPNPSNGSPYEEEGMEDDLGGNGNSQFMDFDYDTTTGYYNNPGRRNSSISSCEDIGLNFSGAVSGTGPSTSTNFQNKDAKQIFVGNLPQTVVEQELQNIFGVFGHINAIKILTNDRNLPFFAFVQYQKEEDVQTVLRCKNNISFPMRNGVARRLNIQQTRPRDNRDRGHGHGHAAATDTNEGGGYYNVKRLRRF